MNKEEFLNEFTIVPFLKQPLLPININNPETLKKITEGCVLDQILSGKRYVKLGNPDTCDHGLVFKVRGSERLYCLLCGYRIIVEKKDDQVKKS